MQRFLQRQRRQRNLDVNTPTPTPPPAGPPPQPAYEYSLHEIYHIAFLLRQRLVPDVVPAIIQYAGILVAQPSPRRVFEPELQVQQRNSPRYIHASPAVACAARTQHPVRRVTFEIESHDQGWASYADAGSWTWFAAEISRHDSDARPDPTTRRDIVRNIAAQRAFQTHIIEWDADGGAGSGADGDEDEQQQQQLQQQQRETAEWVRGLRVGDRVHVLAMAQYPGWQNFVRSVRVTIHTVGVR